ncbi:MAG: DUF5615 family PIN-like protein [Chloroflexi bacterium]|nr:DUF5615 family PIN-like protein [Chloroflexota bacterium]
MPIALYMDQHVHRAITVGLRLRGVDVLTAYEDQASRLSDAALLDRATAIGRALFTQDEDLLAEAAKRQKDNLPFAGIIYAHPLRVSIRACINELEMIAKAGQAEDIINQVQFLPLRR